MKQNGFSLIEMMVVVTIFGLLAVLVSQSIAYSLKGARKSESLTIARSSLTSAMDVIERQLRNAEEIDLTSCASGSSSISYTDEWGVEGKTFSFDTANHYIASGSARLTSEDLLIDTDHSIFSCIQVDPSPPVVKIHIEANSTHVQSDENNKITIDSQISLRNYE